MKTSANSKKTRKDAAHAATPTRTPQDIPAADLRHAPWNPRAKITPESVADLTASIQKDGLIQRLVVVPDGKKYTVVAGNRRLVACRAAGLDPVPCDVMDVTPEAARRLTLLENLQRADVDPLLESDLIEKLIADGMTQAEIAAETGRGARWVARRANLVKLSPAWRKRVADGEQITIDCLEHVAAYPEAIQEKLKCVSQGYSYRATPGGALAWYDVKWQFQRESRDLKEVLFDTAKCLSCPNNTGCCPDLFDDDGRGDAKLGKCLDAKCFAILTEEAVDEAVAKAEKRGRTVVKNKQPYQCGVYGTTKKPTKTNTALYVYTDCNGNRVMEYGAPPPPSEEKKAKSKEEKLAEREERKREKLIRIAQDEAEEKFTDWADEHAKDGRWPQWFVDAAVDDLVREIRDYGAGDLEIVVDQFARNTGFTASDADAAKAYQEYLADAYKEDAAK